MTANAMAGDKEKVLEAGMWDHIAKPLNVGEMFATIAKWIKPKNPGASPTASPGATAQGSATPQTDAQDTSKTIAAQAGQTGVTGQNDQELTSQPAALASLPGIDVKAGLTTTMENEKLYTRLLTKFRDSQGNFAELFAAAQQDADPTAAARAAHTLKGTAGNIGAKGVQAAAAALEHALINKAQPERIAKLLQHALSELAPVIAGLQAIGAAPVSTSASAASTNSSAGAAPAPAVNQAQIQAALVRLTALLKDSDADAGEAVDELLELAQGTQLAFTLKRVAAAVADFDFDAALAQLEKA
jgi:HPt (histidine-containing phosphotransfer) domain-containing protein